MCHRVEGQVRFGLPVPFKLDSIISPVFSKLNDCNQYSPKFFGYLEPLQTFRGPKSSFVGIICKLVTTLKVLGVQRNAEREPRWCAPVLTVRVKRGEGTKIS